MQVFKTFLKVLKKKLPNALIFIGVFMAIAIAMANSGAETAKYEDYEMKIGIIDRDNSKESKALSKFVLNGNKPVDIADDEDEILDAVYYERAGYILIIKEGFGEKLKNGDLNDLFENYKLPSSVYGTLFDNRLDSYLNSVGAYMSSGLEPTEAMSKAQEAMNVETKVTMKNFEDTGNDDYSENFSYYYKYLAYILISVLITALCPVLLIMNRKEIKARTICSSITASSQTFQIFLGSGGFILIIWIFFAAAGYILTDGIMNQKVLLAMLNSFIFIIIAAGIAMLIAAFEPSSNVLNMIANVVGLGMSFLCGVFVPQDLLAEGVLTAGKFLPAYWYVKANNMLAGTCGEVFSKSEIFKCFGVEVLYAVALFAVVMLVMRVKRKEA